MAGSYTTGGGYEPGPYLGTKPRIPLPASTPKYKSPGTSNDEREYLRVNYGITNPTMRDLAWASAGTIAARRAVQGGLQPTSAPTRPSLPRVGSGGGGGGGGGGGAAANLFLTQEQLNAMYELMRAGAPSGQYPQLDLPDYQPYKPKPFDDSYYTGLQGSWNQAVQQDVGTAQQATQNLLDWLGSNYQNAYTNPNLTYATAGQAPGMDQAAMGRFLSQQGADPGINAENVQAQATADAGFGNLWRTLAANEDRNQTNRLGASRMQGIDAENRIRALGLGGTAGINMQRAGALSQYNQRVEDWAREDARAAQEIAQQEAMLNWQQGNTGIEQQQAYRNAALEALLGILPQMAGTNLVLPNAAQLGFQAMPPVAPAVSTLGARPPETPDDPLHWRQIAWDMQAQQQPSVW